ncbi:peptidylprolyl isomerase [Paraliobacillus salinarum]|uniref:peptidylprolyl isomerase n=1 Tax=Paraliobacillus salinarum TaxID=1158996 RepID=UPI0015F780E5|nr:peptidyl-prolyl cis-trans isomerase [Paraliobacillus salinarum]
MRRKLVLGIILGLLLTNIVTLGLWWWNSSTGDVDYSVDFESRKPVAKVNGEKIKYKDWLSYLENQYGKKALQDMIDTQVIKQLADQEDLSINKGVLKLEVSLLATMEGPLSKDAIKDKKKKWAKEVTERLYLEELVTRDISVSEQEIRAYYDKYGDQYNFSPTVQLSHIIVSDEGVADKIMEELDEGTSFSALAQKYSLDEETKSSGGYLGFYTESSSFIPSEYYEQTQQLDDHTYSQPIQTTEGIAIVYLHHYLPEVDLSYEQLHAHIRREIALERMADHPDASKLWNDLEVEWIYQ